MRSDLLSKRLFAAGCLGLPWLWTVHVLYHWKPKGSSGEDDQDEHNEGLLNPDDSAYCYYCVVIYDLRYIHD